MTRKSASRVAGRRRKAGLVWDDAVRIGRELPEVEVGSAFGAPALRVRGKFMCRARVSRTTRGRMSLRALPALEVPVEPRAVAASSIGRTSEGVRTAFGALGERLGSQGNDAVLVLSGVDPASLVPCPQPPGGDRTGFLDPNDPPDGLSGYRPVAAIVAPAADVDALPGLERGDEYRGVMPGEVLADVERRGRTPITIDERMATVHVAPDLLGRNRCSSLAIPRRGDRRLPAIWIPAGAPRLGWRWEGNSHDWLGRASARERVA